MEKSARIQLKSGTISTKYARASKFLFIGAEVFRFCSFNIVPSIHPVANFTNEPVAYNTFTL